MSLKINSLDEMCELLEGMFNNHEIGCIGKRNNNGGDSYFCPSCFSSEYTMGYAYSTAHISDIKHKDDCKLNQLYEFICNRETKNDNDMFDTSNAYA